MSSAEPVEIVVVEDRAEEAELAVRALLRSTVASKVQVVSDGKDALDLLLAPGPLPPRLVFLDLNLPRVSGIEVLRQLRADPRTRTLPVIVLSGSREEQDRVESRRLGASGYILKAVDYEHFLERVTWAAMYWVRFGRDRAEAGSARIRVLVLEDSDADAELLQVELRRAMMDCAFSRVDTREDFARELESFDPELVLADSGFPGFQGRIALDITRRTRPEIPFIYVSGSFRGGDAIETLRQGATDYVLKDRLDRLGYVVQRALVEAQDRLELRRTIEALRESEERYRTLVENAPEAILVLDVELLRYVDANPNAERLFKMSRVELLTKGPVDLGPAPPLQQQSTDALRDWILQAVVGGTPRFEATCRNAMGENIPCEVSLVRLPSAGRVLVRGSILDITDKKKAEEAIRKSEEQLRLAQKMEAVGRLAGGVAHDFNNLLTVITGYSQLVVDRLPAGDPVREYVEEVLRAGDRAAGLTRQLLAFSRRQVLQPRVLDLNSCVAETEKMLRRLIGEDIDFATAFDPGLGRVRADPGQVEQVIVNLVVNARDAMPKGGKLTIATTNVDLDETTAAQVGGIQAGGYVMLAVTDTGCGMDKVVMSHLFEPFFTTKGVGKGTGLGLSTVYGIIRQSGGAIGVYSETGRGSTFKVYLPRVEAPVDRVRKNSSDEPQPRGTETVLLVEDEPVVRTLVRRVLGDNGYTVLEAGHAGEAVPLCRDHPGPIHLLVTDVILPGMGGPDLAVALSAARPAMKILFISGYSQDALSHHGVLQPGVSYLEKPFSPSTLARKVREALDLKI